MQSRNIRPSKSEAIGLSRRGNFTGYPTMSASKCMRGAFGEGLVKGWLALLGHEIRDRPLPIRAQDFRLEMFPSLRKYRLIEIVTTNETLAVEVKTYGSHWLQGASGDTLDDQLTGALRWREMSSDRILALAVINYFGKPMISKSDLNFLRASSIPILRFVTIGMSG